jgi:hypothetical protein
MMRGEEGKLLAGAAGFYSPWGSESDEQAIVFCSALLLSCKKRRFASSAGPAFLFTPIRVREKRMNTYKTGKTCRSYQNINKSICKKSFTTGNLFCWGTYY